MSAEGQTQKVPLNCELVNCVIFLPWLTRVRERFAVPLSFFVGITPGSVVSGVRFMCVCVGWYPHLWLSIGVARFCVFSALALSGGGGLSLLHLFAFSVSVLLVLCVP